MTFEQTIMNNNENPRLPQERTEAEIAALADEVTRWDSGELSPHDWRDVITVPEGWESLLVTRDGVAARQTPISIRMPPKMLVLLKQFARQRDTGYQALIKQWLHERILREANRSFTEKEQ
jgi:predicted DNA binding CopG/RHH family protein